MTQNRFRSLFALGTCVAVLFFTAPIFAEENTAQKTAAPAPQEKTETPLSPAAANAENIKPVHVPDIVNGYTYAPDYCDFTATFPVEPSISTICEEKDPTACYKLASFTKVFDLVSTVKIDVICNPSTEAIYESLNKDRMLETVKAMTKDVVLKTHEVNSRDAEGYRQAGLVGLSKMGMDESIFMAQLWSAKGSLLSVKAQLIGQQMDEADLLFATILKTIGYKKELSAPLPEKPEETPKDKKNSTPPAPKP